MIARLKEIIGALGCVDRRALTMPVDEALGGVIEVEVGDHSSGLNPLRLDMPPEPLPRYLLSHAGLPK